MKTKLLSILLLLLFVGLYSCEEEDDDDDNEVYSEEVVRFDRAGSSILKGVKVPGDKAMYFASGIVANPKDESQAEGNRERFGNTYDQSVSALKRIESYLSEEGLSLKDVVAMKVYVAPDPLNGNKPDFQAWFQAYGEYFDNETNPNKVARSTIGVYQLVDPNKFIEIEIRAVYP